jgi:hypothetical protein
MECGHVGGMAKKEASLIRCCCSGSSSRGKAAVILDGGKTKGRNLF